MAKGKKLEEFEGGRATKDLVAKVLGPTGNLRAPTIVAGSNLMVGFHPEKFEDLFG